MVEFFRGVYGETASIRTNKDGTVQLTIRVGAKMVHKANYNTRRGARIAMGHLSDGWTKR